MRIESLNRKSLKKLREFKDQATKLQVQRTTYEDAIKKAQKAINTFDEENKELITEAEAEQVVVETNKQIAVSYKKSSICSLIIKISYPVNLLLI